MSICDEWRMCNILDFVVDTWRVFSGFMKLYRYNWNVPLCFRIIDKYDHSSWLTFFNLVTNDLRVTISLHNYCLIVHILGWSQICFYGILNKFMIMIFFLAYQIRESIFLYQTHIWKLKGTIHNFIQNKRVFFIWNKITYFS